MKKPAKIKEFSVQEEIAPELQNDLLQVRRIRVVHVNNDENVPMYLKQDPFMKHNGPEPYAA